MIVKQREVQTNLQVKQPVLVLGMPLFDLTEGRWANLFWLEALEKESCWSSKICVDEGFMTKSGLPW